MCGVLYWFVYCFVFSLMLLLRAFEFESAIFSF